MRVRTVISVTAIVSALLGAVVVYLVLTVPNDLKADALLKDARKELAAGKRDAARDALSKIVQEYPRTDAAAAATVALVKLGDQEHHELAAELAQLRNQNAQHTQALTDLKQTVERIKNAPKETAVQKAPAKPKPASQHKPQRRTTRHHRRRR